MKTKKLLTLRQKKLLKVNFWQVFNEIHNSHLSTNVGTVKIKTDDQKKKNNNKQKSKN